MAGATSALPLLVTYSVMDYNTVVKGSYMITLDLRKQRITLEELFQVANSEAVLIVTSDGQEYILEAADDFEREVAQLGQSEKFMQFLAERRNESGRIPLEEVAKRLKPLN